MLDSADEAAVVDLAVGRIAAADKVNFPVRVVAGSAVPPLHNDCNAAAAAAAAAADSADLCAEGFRSNY